MHYEAMLRGDYLAAVEFGERTPTFRIASVSLVDMEMDDGKKKTKGVVYFHETDRGLVMNRTNAEAMARMFGNETNEWAGRRVTLHSVEVQLGPKKVPGIRVLGSPDIPEDITYKLKLPRKRAVDVTLRRT